VKLKLIPLRVVESDMDRGNLYDPERDGVTAGLLSNFKGCRERARLFLVGWTSRREKMATIFGSICHYVLEQTYDRIRRKKLTEAPSAEWILKMCHTAGEVWKKDNPRASGDAIKELELSIAMARVLMPAYFKHHRLDLKRMAWIQLEQEFKIPFEVVTKSGKHMRTFLRGKMDGVFRDLLAGKGSGAIRLLETKTKSRISPDVLVDMLPHDFQTGVYLTALQHLHGVEPSGLIYNIIRRPGQHFKKSDTITSYTARVAKEVQKKPQHYFIRLRVDMSKKDLQKVRQELTALVSDFLLWWAGESGHYKNSDQCEGKYGRCGYLGAFCGGEGAGRSGFFKRNKMFRELEG